VPFRSRGGAPLPSSRSSTSSQMCACRQRRSAHDPADPCQPVITAAPPAGSPVAQIVYVAVLRAPCSLTYVRMPACLSWTVGWFRPPVCDACWVPPYCERRVVRSVETKATLGSCQEMQLHARFSEAIDARKPATAVLGSASLARTDDAEFFVHATKCRPTAPLHSAATSFPSLPCSSPSLSLRPKP
jgi:hypothetical protein